MPKQIDWEEIRKHWQKTGASAQAIADHFGVSLRSVESRLPQWRSTEKLPNVVTLKPKSAESRRQSTQYTHPPIRRSPSVKDEQIDELEAIELAIADLMAALPDASDRGKSAIGGTLLKLFEHRRKLQPQTAAEIAALAIALGISPTEFAREMREQWQQRQA